MDEFLDELFPLFLIENFDVDSESFSCSRIARKDPISLHLAPIGRTRIRKIHGIHQEDRLAYRSLVSQSST